MKLRQSNRNRKIMRVGRDIYKYYSFNDDEDSNML